MIGDKKLDVIEDEYGLSIQFSWFTPMAYFLIFFCIGWDSFLLFWYTSAGGGDAPWIVYVFPLIHVAVGIGLTYYTLCLIFNKTHIDVDDKHLWVHHSPIPWWKGNVDLPVNDIDQIYVKEEKKQGEDGASYTYILLAKLKDGSTEKLLDIGMTDSEKVLQLEELIENYLGIEDYPVRGEYGRHRTAPTTQAKRRRQKRRINAPSTSLMNKHTGDEAALDGTYYRILHDSQYDWKNGNSDKLLQLSDDANNSLLIYIRQNKGVYGSYLEEKLSLYLSNEIAFDQTKPANQFSFQDIQYQLHDFSEGETFLSDQQAPIATKQWLYQSVSGQQNIRIVSNDNMLTYYKGESQKMDDQFDLDETLDLNRPEKRIINNWDEEDLV